MLESIERQEVMLVPGGDMTVTDFLKAHVPFLAGVTDADAAAMAQVCEQVTFKAGQTILMQGVTVDSVHVIAQGSAKVLVRVPGKNPLEVAKLGPGQVFGETSIVEFGVAGATIKAVDECLVFIIPQGAFLTIMEGNPTLKAAVLSQIAARKQSPPKAN
jgi:CRP-like cAMP-binding protein